MSNESCKTFDGEIVFGASGLGFGGSSFAGTGGGVVSFGGGDGGDGDVPVAVSLISSCVSGCSSVIVSLSTSSSDLVSAPLSFPLLSSLASSIVTSSAELVAETTSAESGALISLPSSSFPPIVFPPTSFTDLPSITSAQTRSQTCSPILPLNASTAAGVHRSIPISAIPVTSFTIIFHTYGLGMIGTSPSQSTFPADSFSQRTRRAPLAPRAKAGIAASRASGTNSLATSCEK